MKLFISWLFAFVGHVLMLEDGNVLRMAIDFEFEGHRKKGRPKDMGEKVEDESMKVGFR